MIGAPPTSKSGWEGLMSANRGPVKKLVFLASLRAMMLCKGLLWTLYWNVKNTILISKIVSIV